MESAARLFICSSPFDREWTDRLLHHLMPIQQLGGLEILDYRVLDIQGEGVDSSVLLDVQRATLALILVSPTLLTTQFVDRILPALLARAKTGDLVVWLVHVRPSPWTDVGDLAAFQSVNSPTAPLASLGAERRIATLTSIAQRVGELVRAQAGVGGLGSPSVPPVATAPAVAPSAVYCVFVSHVSEDGDFAEMMAMKMKEAGYTAWIDVDRLKPGVDWQESIDEAIRKAPALIAIMSPEARTSEYVTYEWSFAAGCGVLIIPVMLRETSLHPRLARLHFLDFTKRSARPWDGLFEQLKAAVAASRSAS
jgi:hypothetical protein